MKLRKFILITAIILMLGFNLVGRGIEGVVGEGPWQAVGYKLAGSRVEITLFGNSYHLDYRPVKYLAARGTETVKNELLPQTVSWLNDVKWKANAFWQEGKDLAILLWENTQNKVSRLTGE